MIVMQEINNRAVSNFLFLHVPISVKIHSSAILGSYKTCIAIYNGEGQLKKLKNRTWQVLCISTSVLRMKLSYTKP